MKRSIILDTDIGDDIDDVLALVMALNSEMLDIKAITTVHAEVDIRSQLAAKTLDVAGASGIPIASGYSRPYNQEPRTGFIAPQLKILENEKEYGISPLSATELIRETLRNCPGSCTLVCIGPLTNAAHFLEQNTVEKEKIEEIVLMGGGGVLHGKKPEYNIQSDPEAADIVFNSGISIRILPFDVSKDCKMSSATLERLLNASAPLQRLLGDMIKYWQDFNYMKFPILYDPLTIGALIKPAMYRFERFDVRVELKTEKRRGQTIAARNPNSNILVCTDVDFVAFQSLFNSLILQDIKRAVS